MRRSRTELPLPKAEELGAFPQEQRESALDVRRVLARMPDGPRRLLELFYFDGFSLAEIAAMTGRSPQSVKTALWRARATFAEKYGAPV
ncbi:RNA polymerase sigma factor, sigma-70 family [Sinosporangium album]|uniref:RNA polymerase sigma factor, sigma-70 family n=2 Tax=Sinosporangium album TaxID=504805 RepID=A0A1G7W193_9ACTN|nr:RNA polymerase sigma factor, sigma-70 family [Sinosporangium album]